MIITALITVALIYLFIGFILAESELGKFSMLPTPAMRNNYLATMTGWPFLLSTGIYLALTDGLEYSLRARLTHSVVIAAIVVIVGFIAFTGLWEIAAMIGIVWIGTLTLIALVMIREM